MCKTSRYSAAWEALKQQGKITLVILPGLHKRIIKAIRKRKDLDTAFRFTALENRIKYSLSYELSDNGRVLHIKLAIKNKAPEQIPKRLKLIDRI